MWTLIACVVIGFAVYAILMDTNKADRAGTLLQSDDPARRIQGILWIRSAEGDEHLNTLINMLQHDEDAGVRAAAAEALGRRKDERALPALTEALQDDQEDVQYAAIAALSAIGSTDAISALAKYVSNADGVNQLYAIRAIGDIGGTEAVKPLFLLLNGADKNACEEIVRQLVDIGTGTVEPLAEVMPGTSADSRYYAALAISRIGGDKAVQVLNDFLAEGDLAVIAGAHAYYIRLGREGTEELLISALKSHGNSSMAEAYLNSGNALLEDAATQWAQVHGYTIQQEYSSGSLSKWGAG